MFFTQENIRTILCLRKSEVYYYGSGTQESRAKVRARRMRRGSRLCLRLRCKEPFVHVIRTVTLYVHSGCRVKKFCGDPFHMLSKVHSNIYLLN